MRLRILTLALGASLLTIGCTDPLEETDYDGGVTPTVDTAKWVEAGTVCNDPKGDWDGDGIPNGDEGCLSGRDTDSDKVPDWQDLDSDGDKIPDSVESGSKSAAGKCAGAKSGKDGWPCDNDGDKVPDYLDLDSDGDGLKDGAEDENGDGLLGCCLTTCNAPGATWQKGNCILTKDGCGNGQKCVNKKCVPAVAFKCSEGETSAKKKDTFGDGKLDNERGTFICRDATEDKPQGRKPVQVRYDKTGDWKIAVEKGAKYGPMTIASASTMMRAASIDHSKSTEEASGFILSKVSTGNVQTELAALVAAIQSNVPGGSGTVTVRASGIQRKSHDRYNAVQGSILDVKLSSATNVSQVRNQLVAALLGKTMADLSNLPQPYGSSATEFVLRFTTIKRFEFKKDSNQKLVLDKDGNPQDSGDKTKWRLVVMGGVATKLDYQSPTRRTGFIVDDLSNGTSVAVMNDTVENECDVGTIQKLPVADIVWVIDESGSMSDNRQDIVNNANNFFSRALSSGLDFRMGVTNVCAPTGSYKAAVGKFCSKVSTSSTDDGGTDRFLLPSEQTTFSSCIKNPPGYEGGSEYGLVNAEQAVKKHLPRATNSPDKIRTNATLVIIVATDEIPNGLYSVLSGSYTSCTLAAAKQASLNSAIQKYIDLFTGVTDPEGTAMFHVIGGVCSNSCYADVAHGYKDLAQKLGGQWADVCQKNLGNTLQVIIDSITGAASPIKLDYVPISSSLAVAMDAIEVKRSRTNGFDYRSNKNTLVFINVKYKKGSEVIASYKRWKRQEILQ